ncbi:hypothetical protein P4B35_03135 [Pontiellaceae bacterium B12227]|nr:hypothetical protein [Pontiellaceae bacterium B12227]
MKKLNLEKGLLRLYIISTLCGIACIGGAAYNHQNYKKTLQIYSDVFWGRGEGPIKTLQEQKKSLWKRYEAEEEKKKFLEEEYRAECDSHSKDLKEGDIQSEQRWLIKITNSPKLKEIQLKDAYLEELLEDTNEKVDELSLKISEVEDYYFQSYYKPAQKAKKHAKAYTYLFVSLSLLPWVIHYICKLVLLPIIRWLINGFRV